MTLVEILSEWGLISPSDVQAAMCGQGTEDGKVAAFLVESGAITVDQLAQALSKQFGVPSVSEADLARADPNWFRRLRAHQATRLQAIPLYMIQSRRVAVAMVNPSDPRTLDELAFVLGAAVEPMVVPEMALNRQLELLYGMPRRRTTGFFPVGSEAGTPPSRTSRPTISTPPPKGLRRTLTSQFAVVDLPPLAPLVDPAASFVTPPPTPAPTAPTPRPVSPSHPATDPAVERVLYSDSRQAAADNLFAFMASCFGAGAMFNVNGIVAQGRFGFHQDRVCAGVGNLMFSLCLPSCFALAYSRGTLFHGSPSSDGNVVHRPLWSALGCDRPRDVLVAPVFEAGQITILLYAQGRSGMPIEPMIVGRMENVCAALDSVLARIPA